MSTGPFDYIVVGAGAAGCVIAARLSEDPSTKILVLEAGGQDRGFAFSTPALVFALATASESNWFFDTEPNEALNSRTLRIQQGKVLGGSSSVNGMQYTRGHPHEYDAWNCEGWAFADVLPYFRKAESNARGDSYWHGASGPVPIRQAKPQLTICEAFLSAMADVGFPILADVNQDDIEGFGYSDVNIHRGKRQSTASAYLRPVQYRKNLTILTGAQALRIIVEHGQARGVEIAHDGQRKQLFCDREVIVCAGAVKSPHLLLLSGIGPAEDLRAVGVQPIVDSPGVGQNFQNHHGYKLQYSCNAPVTSYKFLRPGNALKEGLKYLLFREGALGESVAGIYGRFRSDPRLTLADTHITMMTSLVTWPRSAHPKAWQLLPREDGFSFSVHPEPFSRGEIRLRSADPLENPRVLTNHFSDQRDMAVMIAAIRRMREAMQCSSIQKYVKAEIQPGDAVTDDVHLEADIRAKASSSYHPGGSCRMGSDTSSVVDPQLRVRGIGGLRVADASIIPVLPNCGLHGPAIMIGEKAASIVRAVPEPLAAALH